MKTLDDFSKLYKTLVLRGIPVPINLGVDTDMKNTKRHLLYAQGPGVILPDASYYKPEMAEQKAQILGIWTNVAKMVMAQTNLSAEDQEKYVADTLAFDEIIGGLVKTQEEWSRYTEMYNPMDTDKVKEMLSTLDLDLILNIVLYESYIINYTFYLYFCFKFVHQNNPLYNHFLHNKFHYIP